MQLDFENLRNDIAKTLDIAPEELAPHTILAGNEKWDSFSILATVGLITEHTGKQITMTDIIHLETVADLINLFQKLKDC
ncbi:acyl carrier protein [Xenorhabdus bovienii]|uniref:Putative Acyl carrier protein n=1 Tax=Xenorhabdus bovienii str. Intermedium TaxID=1379677 RepID=A0A077Q3V7_XENBV|nr:acyl carrier protein [Xenorhabdus bovienii]CDH30862.1 putative Acyl carrier protein [Xenorhabdus bovienii str. Intermedium]